MPKSSNTIKTPIIDKNGKATHVHKKVDDGTSEKSARRAGKAKLAVVTVDLAALRANPIEYIKSKGGSVTFDDEQRDELWGGMGRFDGARVSLIEDEGKIKSEVTFLGVDVSRHAADWSDTNPRQVSDISRAIERNIEAINAELGNLGSLSYAGKDSFDITRVSEHYEATGMEDLVDEIEADGELYYLEVYTNGDLTGDDDAISEIVMKAIDIESRDESRQISASTRGSVSVSELNSLEKGDTITLTGEAAKEITGGIPNTEVALYKQSGALLAEVSFSDFDVASVFSNADSRATRDFVENNDEAITDALTGLGIIVERRDEGTYDLGYQTYIATVDEEVKSWDSVRNMIVSEGDAEYLGNFVVGKPNDNGTDKIGDAIRALRK